MSHAATNWAIKQRGLSPAAKIVLWHLCDRYHPDNGCFPSQASLAYDCEVSRASINRLLSELEAAELVRREKRVDERTRRQMSTMYRFAFEDGFASVTPAGTDEEQPAGAVSQNATRAVSHLSAEPCLKSDDFRVSNCDTNTVREPVREPVKAGFVFSQFAEKFFSIYPKPGDRATAEDLLGAAINEDGADPDHILAAARAYAAEKAGTPAQYVAHVENWIGRRKWEEFTPARVSSDDEVRKMQAETIKTGKRFLCTRITAVSARDLIARDLVTEAECRSVGVL